ncbi:MAG: Outer membrane protein assembly factor BamB [Phycisphaerae bacterium]|nr:Outer membrane protein assembly factor BamB [Phycisphaerae bacterium]
MLLSAGVLCAWTGGARAGDPYKTIYKDYRPDFMDGVEGDRDNRTGWHPDAKTMELSTEPKFFTLCMLHEDSRAVALVEAGLKKEADGQYQEALKVYQQVIEKYPSTMYRVSDYGVFVPVAQYCQRRILGFPAAELSYYRTMYDAPAKEAFEQARRQYSLLGLSDIVDGMLATSYGGAAVLELGNAALDSGHYLAALEYFTTVRDFFPDARLHTKELELKIAYCHKMLGMKDSPAAPKAPAADGMDPDALKQMQAVVNRAAFVPPPFHSQLASEPGNIASDDYTLPPPTGDALALQPPVWEFTLPGSRRDFYSYTQPVMSDTSVVYRHKNIVYCRSILNGELRWTNDLGGRAVWQNFRERQYPQEDLIVQDGMVFTVISKGGPSLVALDEVTGNLRWAYGPMVASNEEEARMRFEAAPAGGPRTIYAGYVLDNIEGETHTDSEYGVIAFDSTTGRVHWRVPICRLAPGKFSGGFAEQRRNRIRSFTSPPLYHQGTVYYCTNAGAIAALDALSGRIKWLSRYPYYTTVHDATRQFGSGGDTVQYTSIYFTPHNPMFWYNQRPLLVDEDLYILPVDSPYMFSMDRRTGCVQWSRYKHVRSIRREDRYTDGGPTYLLGPTRKDQLVLVHSGPTDPVQIVNRKTGKTEWISDTLEKLETSPVASLDAPQAGLGRPSSVQMNYRWYCRAARPLLTSDDRLYTTGFTYIGWPIFGWGATEAEVDLDARKITAKRRYFDGALLGAMARAINSNAPEALQANEEIPNKDERTKQWIENMKKIVVDQVPVNDHGPFFPFSRLTANRYGVPIELRFGARSIAMVYDRDAITAAIAKRNDPQAAFAKAELAVADSRLDEAAALLKQCLATISSEDLDFRAAINQQLYRVFQRLARRAIRANRPDDELANCLGMSRTASTLAEEIETLFAVADAMEHRGQVAAAGKVLRTIISTYGTHEYPIAPISLSDPQEVTAAASQIFTRYSQTLTNPLFEQEIHRSIALMNKSLPLYFATVSPLPKTLTVRAGELAAMRLMLLQKRDTEFAAAFAAAGKEELPKSTPEEQLTRLWEFPATPAAQETLDALFKLAADLKGTAGQLQMWQLADASRVSGLKVDPAYRDRVAAPVVDLSREAVADDQKPRIHEWSDEEGAARLALERRGDRTIAPEVMFIGARVRRRLDNKFTVTAINLADGRTLWETDEMRLKGKGAEPGFFEAFVHRDLVLVHGLYDVLALEMKSGKVRWSYRVPFDFEIRHALLSGDLMILSGKSETLALYADTDSAAGEVVWQVGEMGDIYSNPWMRGDRLICVRKLPYNVTVRYRNTGRLIGRMNLPDLSMFTDHPLLENGPAELPIAHHDQLLAVSDGWYYIMIDTDRMKVLWKRLIDSNDLTREPAMRFALGARYMTVLKEDYDQKMIYLLSAATGEVLWKTDPKDSRSPQPMYSVIIDGEKVYGIQPHAGQGYYVVGREGKTGTLLFRTEITGYDGKPEVNLIPRVIGGHVVARVGDRQMFELRAFELTKGKNVVTVKEKGVGPFDVHGHISGTVQAGRLILLSKDKLSL